MGSIEDSVPLRFYDRATRSLDSLRRQLPSAKKNKRITDLAQQELVNTGGGIEQEAHLTLSGVTDGKTALRAIDGYVPELEDRMHWADRDATTSRLELAHAIITASNSTPFL